MNNISFKDIFVALYNKYIKEGYSVSSATKFAIEEIQSSVKLTGLSYPCTKVKPYIA